jgi:protein-tyrosine phosphatase
MPFGPYDRFNRVLGNYRRNRVKTVVVLVTHDEIEKKCRRDLFAVYAKYGITVLHTPVPDLTSPSHAMVSQLVDKMQARLEEGGRIAVHCNAGVGRTSVILACVVKRLRRLDGKEAARYVRGFLHVNLTDEQQRFIAAWDDNPSVDQPVLTESARKVRIQP